MTWFSQALPGPWVTGHLCRGFLSKGRLACGSREQVEEWRELRDSHCGSRMELVTSQQERLEEEHAGGTLVFGGVFWELSLKLM